MTDKDIYIYAEEIRNGKDPFLVGHIIIYLFH